jgi:hypothetical protein
MELAIPEFLFGLDITGLFDDFHTAIFDFPAGRLAFFIFPFGKIRSIKKHDGI